MSTRGAADAPEVLIIEDDPTIGRNLHAGLVAGGHAAKWCRTGEGGLAHAAFTPPDVVLLDLGLPDVDGIEIARALRSAHPQVVIVILTARADDIDIVVGLDAGADDYLVKPVTITVLLARLRAHLRRRPEAAGGEEPIRFGDLVLDVPARRCLVAQRQVELRAKEFDLLTTLARRAGTAVSRQDLMAEVWDENWFGSTKTLDVTMAALRRRLAEAAAETTSARMPAITTLRHHGYRLDAPPASRP